MEGDSEKCCAEAHRNTVGGMGRAVNNGVLFYMDRALAGGSMLPVGPLSLGRGEKWEAMGKEVDRELRGLVAEPRFAITSTVALVPFPVWPLVPT